MKVKDIIPVISSIIVVIDDLKYKDTLCKIEVECLSLSNDDNNPVFSPTKASCEKPYFKMGSSFWKEEFGTRQTNRIKKLCDESIKKYVEEA